MKSYVVTLGVLQMLFILDNPASGSHALGEAAGDLHAQAK